MFALKTKGMNRLLAILFIFATGIAGCSMERWWGEQNSLAAEAPPDTPSPEALATGLPELPRVYIDTTYVPPTGGKTINVTASDNLQNAINSAQPGDILVLQAGATFKGRFELPKKTGDKWIVIRTSTPDSALPPPGTRITPAQANLMPKIVTDNEESALVTANGAHHFRFIGIEFAVAPGTARCYNLVALGGDEMKTLADLPNNLIFDRVYVHGNSTGNLRRGIALNSGSTAIIDSWVDEVHEIGADSQGIGGWSGTGPYKIVNCHIEGAAENVLLGGATPLISGTVPTDIEFRRNYLFKPLRWKSDDPSYAGRPWVVKNLFELKSARRVLMEGNVLEHNWLSGQQGNCILFTVRTENGEAPQAVVNDVTVINNVIRNVAGAFELSGLDNLAPASAPGESRRILIKNNLLDEVNGAKWNATTNGVFIKIAAAAEVTVDHNTILNTGNTITAHTLPSPNFVFTNNVIAHNDYGMIGDSRGPGFESINHFFPGYVIKRNVIAGADPTRYPTDNFYPPNLTAVKFVAMGSNYRLAPDSPYRNQATDGSDLGANFDALSDRFIATSVSAASYQAARLAPEMISAVFGGKLATSTLVATQIPLPTTLGGTSVRFRDASGTERSAPLFFVSPTQINYLIPAGTAPGSGNVTIYTSNGAISQGMTTVANVAPGIFAADASGKGLPTGQVVRVKGDGSQQYETIARFDQSLNQWVAVPIDLGVATDQVVLVLYGTGLRFRSQLSAVSVKVGGVDCQVIFAGPTPGLVGLDQLNVILPRSLAGRGLVNVEMNVDGQAANMMQVSMK
jgi:uncharacterized protein (TIGR03437 family)